MKNLQKISVIIPAYNAEKYISYTLDSVLQQTYKLFEIIIVDDGSTDSTARQVKKLDDPRIRYVFQENKGVSAARNAGISLAKYGLIAFLDSDDLWDVDYLESIVYLTRKYSEASAFATAYRFRLSNKKSVHANFSLKKKGIKDLILEDYFSASLKDPIIGSSSVAVRKEVFEKIGGFPVGHQLSEDLDTWARIALNYQIAIGLIPKVTIRRNTPTMTSCITKVDRDFIVIDTLEDILEGYEGNAVPIKKYLSIYCKKCGMKYFKTGKKEDAKRMLVKAKKYALETNCFSQYIRLVLIDMIYFKKYGRLFKCVM